MLTHLRISWFLDNPELGWTPPQTLIDWMAKARADKKAIVYIGFGSITVPDPKLVTERIIRSVLKSEYWPLLMAGRPLTESGCAQAECALLSLEVGQHVCRRARIRILALSPSLKNVILLVSRHLPFRLNY
jgi:hypothetical protein